MTIPLQQSLLRIHMPQENQETPPVKEILPNL